MKRLIVIVEGVSEEEFVNRIIKPYLYSKEIFCQVDCFKVKHSKGGLSKYSHVKKDIINSIYETNAIITTLFDFYALPTDFPGFEKSKRIVNKSDRLAFIEDSIKADIEQTQNAYFSNLIPYIQLHEFEALIFSSIQGIEELFESSEANFEELQSIINKYPNPEDINDHPKTAPSKRLKDNIIGYSKVNDGILILDEIGINTIINKCPRFAQWLTKIMNALRN